MSSNEAAKTALAGSCLSVFAGVEISDEYRIVLPPLATGIILLNTVFLQGDLAGRPYKVDDFENEIRRLHLIDNIKALGTYQMNHL